MCRKHYVNKDKGSGGESPRHQLKEADIQRGRAVLCPTEKGDYSIIKYSIAQPPPPIRVQLYRLVTTFIKH